jgi:hypothetical protein
MTKWHKDFFFIKIAQKALYFNMNVLRKQMTLGYTLLTCDVCLQIPLPTMPLGI